MALRTLDRPRKKDLRSPALQPWWSSSQPIDYRFVSHRRPSRTAPALETDGVTREELAEHASACFPSPDTRLLPRADRAVAVAAHDPDDALAVDVEPSDAVVAANRERIEALRRARYGTPDGIDILTELLSPAVLGGMAKAAAVVIALVVLIQADVLPPAVTYMLLLVGLVVGCGC
jgi:hypothetical protein